jgi:hypothetical protein
MSCPFLYKVELSSSPIKEVGTPNSSVVVTVPPLTILAWDAAKYVTVTEPPPPRSAPSLTFILNQEAFDYRDFMRLPGPIRSVQKLWWKLTDDVPSLIWGVVGGTLVFIIEKLLTWLF